LASTPRAAAPLDVVLVLDEVVAVVIWSVVNASVVEVVVIVEEPVDVAVPVVVELRRMVVIAVVELLVVPGVPDVLVMLVALECGLSKILNEELFA